MKNKREHNREMRLSAEYRAEQMRLWPSPLEEKMKHFLDRHLIIYKEQEVFYIHDEEGRIARYYIADFYIESLKVIIEVDGKFHDRQRLHDKNRTKEIQGNYPDIKVLRFREEDLSNEEKMAGCLGIVDNYFVES